MPGSPDEPPRPFRRLRAYREKRDPDRTPEPFGGEEERPPAGPALGGALFVVHHHHARNLHWDLRLELDGALESWAVPKGPSPDPDDRRLAIRVEPHPLDYADFEGVIPAGQYGAGPSIVWDRGVWIPRGEPGRGLEEGKLRFELRGFKLRGLWRLVHAPGSGEDHWLLVKEEGDAGVDREGGTGALPPDSIYSGLEVDELPRAAEHRERIREAAGEAGGSPSGLDVTGVEAMKATRRREPFDDPDWVFEVKYDGYRLLAERRDDGSALLLSRNGNDLTATFPEIARAVRGLPYEGAILDGEVVVHDERGLPSFARLQKRGRLRDLRDIARAVLEHPATLYAFDLLAVEGLDLRPVPLTDRKEILRRLLPTVGPVRYSEHFDGRGIAVYREMEALGLEGIVAKRADSRYRGGRSRSWYKIRIDRSDDFVVVGWKESSSGRAFGSLHLAQYVPSGPTLVWTGSVGTGFTDALRAELHPRLLELEEALEGGPPAAPPEGSKLPRGPEHHWIRPEVVVEVKYREITDSGLLRHPSLARIRDDKEPRECVREGDASAPDPESRGAGGAGPTDDPAGGEVEAAAHRVPATHRDKVFWPGAGAEGGEGPPRTKGDLIDYYETIAPWILPWLADRPLVLTRFPDGIHGKSFFQKDAPAWTPDWVRTVEVESSSGEREISYFVADEVETLRYVANLGSIPLHVWHARAGSLERPDWCLLDLDPKEAAFGDVVEIALFLRELCEGIGLPSYVKTSGATGLHVMIPLGGTLGWKQSRRLGELLAALAVRALPEIATVERSLSRRGGKVYVDYLQNARGQLVVAPFSVRARPGATVSTPLRWKEVRPDLSTGEYTIDSVPRRMRALKEGDPMRPLLDDAPDIGASLAVLADRM